MADFAFRLQVGEMPEGVEIAVVGVIPPVELQQVETVHAHPPERGSDRLLDEPPDHPARIRNPFCQRLNFGEPGGPVAGCEAAPKGADEILGRAVMVGEVPSREPDVVVSEHLLDGAGGIDGPVAARDLPHAIQNAADAEIRG